MFPFKISLICSFNYTILGTISQEIKYPIALGNWFTELWQLQKVLTDDRTNFYEVCLLALFLDIPAAELVNQILPEKTKQQLFDEEIHRLHEQGLKYPEIAKRLHASYDVVKSIGEGRYKVYEKKPSCSMI